MCRVIGTISLTWLVIAISISSSLAQSDPVLDTVGQALLPGVEYYILPVVDQSSSGGLTLVNRNNSCPLYVGQDPNAGSQGYPVVITPFTADSTVIGENRDFKIAFSASSICVSSTAWLNGGTDAVTGRRLIVTGTGERGYGGYFKISKSEEGNGYNIRWCPSEACPLCRFDCGIGGVFVENGKRILALDRDVPALAVVFKRA